MNNPRIKTLRRSQKKLQNHRRNFTLSDFILLLFLSPQSPSGLHKTSEKEKRITIKDELI